MAFKLDDVIQSINANDGLKKKYMDLVFEYEKLRKEKIRYEEKCNQSEDTMDKLSDPTSTEYLSYSSEADRRVAYDNAKAEYDDSMKEIDRITDELNDLNSKIEDVKNQLNGMIEILAKDPIINKELVKHIQEKYDIKIKNAFDEQIEASDKNDEIIESALGEDAGDQEVQELIEELRREYNNYQEKKYTIEKDTAFSRYKDVKKRLNDTIKRKYNVELEREDIETIVTEKDKDKLRLYKIKELEIIMMEKYQEVTDLEHSKNEVIAKIENAIQESVISVGDSSSISRNKDEITSIDAEIEEAERQDSYLKMSILMNRLKANGMIVPEMIPEITDSGSEIRIAFNNFVDASERVKRAFLNAKRNPTDNNISEVMNASSKYKECCDEMARLTGLTPDIWQNYINREIDEGKMLVEGKEDIYFNTENLELNSMANNTIIKSSPIAESHYELLLQQTEAIDAGQKEILETGEISSDPNMTLEKLFRSDTYGNYADNFENLIKDGVPVKSILSREQLDEKRKFTIKGAFKGFFGMIFKGIGGVFSKIISKIRNRENNNERRFLKDISIGAKHALDEYEEQNDEDKDEYLRIQRLKNKRIDLQERNREIIANTQVTPSQIDPNNIRTSIDNNRDGFRGLSEYLYYTH